MKAIFVREFGGPEVLRHEEIPDPTPGRGEVRVRVHAVGVNPFDTYMRTGLYARKPPLPYIPGADAAGVVDQVGEGVTEVAEGQRVYFGGTAQDPSWGAYAELAVCRPAQLHRLPERASFAQGAAVNVPYVTAWRALFSRGQARPGDVVFIHGASGGVGVAATQIARASGLTVIGSAGSAEGLAFVQAQGAHHVLNHRESGYLERLGPLTGGRGPDIIVEMLANVNLDHDLSVVAREGRVVIVGNRGRIEIDPRKAMGKDAAVWGLSFWNSAPDELARVHRALVAGLESGALEPAIGLQMPLAEAPRAHGLVMEGTHQGKIVLTP